MSFNKIIKDTLIYTIGPQIPALIGVFMIPVLTPYLTSRDYGIQGTILAWYGGIIAIKDLGLNVVISNLYYKSPTRYKIIWNKLFAVLTIWTAFLAIVSAIMIKTILPIEEQPNFWFIVLTLCIPFAVTDATNFFANRYYQLEQKPIFPVVVSITSGILSILASYYFIKILKLGYLGMFYSGCVSSIISFIINIFLITRHIGLKPDFKFSYAWLKKKLIISLPLVPHYYSVFLLDTSDRIILNAYKVDIKEIGIYNYGYNIGSYFQIITYALATAAGPVYLSLFHKKNMESEIKARDLTLTLQTALSIIAFTGALWIKEIMELIVRNEELKLSYSISAVIIMSYSFRAMYFATITKLSFLEKTKVNWKITFVGGLLNVALNIIFVPFYGIWASVVSTFLALLYINFSGYWMKDFRENNSINYFEKTWMIIIISLTIIAYLLKDIYWLNKIFITTTLFIVVYYLLFVKNFYRKYFVET